MYITIECDSDQPRNPDNQPPPYRDGCEVMHYVGIFDKWVWFCPCDGWYVDGGATEDEARRELIRHLYVTHGE